MPTKTKAKRRKAKSLSHDTHLTFLSECYMVGIDSFFLGQGRWSDNPSWARKYSDPGKAAQDMEDLKLAHPSAHIRVVRARARWTIAELP